ncbi:hypothetical protein Scep_015436 [Stephania cephalantha]|uniref:Uncharacterized protein n=1 Tax=Stephania cephalantha TaxID=152367 RepID=A0AAP0J3Z5_9MAGN
MASKVENRIFVGGLSWETSDRDLEDAFGRYGKIVEAQLFILQHINDPFFVSWLYVVCDILRHVTSLGFYSALVVNVKNARKCYVLFEKFVEAHRRLLQLHDLFVAKPVAVLSEATIAAFIWMQKSTSSLSRFLLRFLATISEASLLACYGFSLQLQSNEVIVSGRACFLVQVVRPSLLMCLASSNNEIAMPILWIWVMLERDTGRPRGFGFVTFSDHRAMDDAIREMHGRELGERVISVNKAQPKMGDDPGYGYGGGYSSGGRSGYGGGGGDRGAGKSDCFKCGRPGHWARECPSAGGGGGGGGGGRFSSRSRFSGGGGRGDRFGGDRYGDRIMDDRYDGGRYGDRDRLDSRDSSRYGARDRYPNDRYAAGGDRFSGDRYGGSDRYTQNGYGKDKSYDRDAGPRSGGDRYGSGGPTRFGSGGYRERPGPYERPARGGGRPSSFDDRY